ncbi:hypothetical protein [Aminipila sp.]|uniref:hypothetical protein n=1 Tax=Aminipila sp. TaxID=2060095 RepID=UPI0028999793|nr:hypothetical protein [Aminipila sp.]
MKTEEDLWEIVQKKLDQKYPPAEQEEEQAGTDESDAIMDMRIKEGIKLLLEEKRKAGMPVAGYDMATKKAYVEYADGRKEYVTNI